MKDIKHRIGNFIFVCILLFILMYVYTNKASISSFIVKKYVVNNELKSYNKNEYSKNESYAYVQITRNYTPSNKVELNNLLYTILDSGWDEFEFYCDDKYTNCIDDIKKISNDGTLNYLNNYVHPYNTYKTINISINTFGIVHVRVTHQYTSDEINAIKNKMNQIMNNIITTNMTTEEKILTFHDYIVDNTIYDSAEADLVTRNLSLDLESYKAYNVLINNIGLCGGYADTLSIFLNKLGIDNYKISTENHIWNALKLNNKWYHIDMTWDDPVSSNNVQHLLHDYYMITTNELFNLNDGKHIFNQDVYIELKQA